MKALLVERDYVFLRFGNGTLEIWKHLKSGSTVLVTRSGLGDSRAKQNWIHRLK